MHYHIDKTAAQSAYLQLYHQLRRDIVSGVYPLGTKLPSKRGGLLSGLRDGDRAPHDRFSRDGG